MTEWTWEIPDTFNIGAACTDLHAQGPKADHIAMIVEDADLGEDRISYRQLSEQSSRFAAALLANEVKKGARVLVRLPNSLAYPISFFGAMKAGCIAVPSSTLLSASEMAYLAQDSEADVLVAHVDMWAELQDKLDEVPSLKQVWLTGCDHLPANVHSKRLQIFAFREMLQKHAPIEAAVATSANDPAYLVYTSGTTGFPKGVLHAHRALLGRMPAATHWFDFKSDNKTSDRILHSGKFNWTYVLGTALMDPLYLGHTVVAYEGPNDANLWTRLIAKHQCTIFIGVPTIYRQILQKTSASKSEVPSLRHCMCAGEHLSDDVLIAWQERFGQPIFEAIGMSEFSYYISHPPHKKPVAGAAGVRQPGHQVQLVSPDDLQPVPVGEEGMIAIPLNDPGLFLEYWRLPEENEKQRRNGLFLTGDFAWEDENGYIWFMGRRDDVIKSFGYRVSPHEIERVMKSHPAVADCVSLGQVLDASKTLVVSCIIRRPGENVSEEALLAFAQKELAAYKVPKRIFFFDEFPRTKNGKVLRKQLIEQLPQH